MTDKLPDALQGLPIDHIGIAVDDLDEAEKPYQLLGLPRAGKDEVIAAQHVCVRVLRVGDSLLELLAPTSSESPIAKFLAKRGAGLHHLALRVTELELEIERLSAQGAVFISAEPQLGRGGSRVVFLHPTWSGGVLLELIEHTAA